MKARQLSREEKGYVVRFKNRIEIHLLTCVLLEGLGIITDDVDEAASCLHFSSFCLENRDIRMSLCFVID